MKRSFVRALWGDSRRVRVKTYHEVLRSIQGTCPTKEPWLVYVWGDENDDLLQSLGFNTFLVSSDPYQFDSWNLGGFWRHKLLAWHLAARHFDEFIFCDWDCYPDYPLPDTFWDTFYEKEPFQALLHSYKRAKIFWRRHHQRKLPSAGLVYFRDMTVPDVLLKISTEHPDWTEEAVMAYYIDAVLGKWNNGTERECLTQYLELFEPHCAFHKASPYHIVPDLDTKKVRLFAGPC